MSPHEFAKLLSDLEAVRWPTDILMKKILQKNFARATCESKLEIIEHLTVSLSDSAEWNFRKVLIKDLIEEKKDSPNFLMKISYVLNRSTMGMLDHEEVKKVRCLLKKYYQRRNLAS